MPYVNVQLTKEGLTRAKKAELVRRFTEALVEVLGKQPEHTHIVIDEVDDENWGYAGVLTDEWRRTQA
jgi:4-oxalocrotonate tautomerase